MLGRQLAQRIEQSNETDEKMEGAKHQKVPSNKQVIAQKPVTSIVQQYREELEELEFQIQKEKRNLRVPIISEAYGLPRQQIQVQKQSSNNNGINKSNTRNNGLAVHPMPKQDQESREKQIESSLPRQSYSYSNHKNDSLIRTVERRRSPHNTKEEPSSIRASPQSQITLRFQKVAQDSIQPLSQIVSNIGANQNQSSTIKSDQNAVKQKVENMINSNTNLIKNNSNDISDSNQNNRSVNILKDKSKSQRITVHRSTNKEDNGLRIRGDGRGSGGREVTYQNREMEVVRLPSEDEVRVEEMHMESEQSLLERYVEFLNGDNDIFYLEGIFPRFYGESASQMMSKQESENVAVRGALAVCFNGVVSQQDYRQVNSNARVSLKKIANNPMIQAGLSSTQSHASLLLANISSPHDWELTSNRSQASHMNTNTSHISGISAINSPNNNQYNNVFMNQNSNENSMKNINETNNINNISNNIDGNHSRSSQNSMNKLSNKMNGLGLTGLSRSDNVREIQFSELKAELERVWDENKNHQVSLYKVFIVTKFKVRIDVGFVQVSFNMQGILSGDPRQRIGMTCVIHRLYVSRIYRKLNYAHYIYLRVYEFIFSTMPHIDRIAITFSAKQTLLLKFQQQIGFKLDNITHHGANKSHQVKLILKRNDYIAILNHILSYNSIDKPGLESKQQVQKYIQRTQS